MAVVFKLSGKKGGVKKPIHRDNPSKKLETLKTVKRPTLQLLDSLRCLRLTDPLIIYTMLSTVNKIPTVKKFQEKITERRARLERLYISYPQTKSYIFTVLLHSLLLPSQILISISFKRYGTLNTRLSVFPEEAGHTAHLFSTLAFRLSAQSQKYITSQSRLTADVISIHLDACLKKLQKCVTNVCVLNMKIWCQAYNAAGRVIDSDRSSQRPS